MAEIQEELAHFCCATGAKGRKRGKWGSSGSSADHKKHEGVRAASRAAGADGATGFNGPQAFIGASHIWGSATGTAGLAALQESGELETL